MTELILSPDQIPVISRQNARIFHDQVKERIKDTGDGLFEYIELIKFVEKLSEVISGNSQSKILPDTELREMVRTEVAKYGKDGFVTKRGAKFQLAEVGYKYDYEACGDPVYEELASALEFAKEQLKARQEFLMNVPKEGLDIITPEGQVVQVFPPNKTSTSSYKVTLPK